MQLPVTFFAEGLRLDGDLHLPADHRPGERLPAVVACSGYQGLKTIHPARFARALVPHRYAVLSFDYRGFGRSDGERGRLVPQDQVEDVRAAVSFLETRDEVDGSRIALLGWALGGGVVIAEAASDDRVRAVAACNPIGDGARSLRFMHDPRTWERLIERIEAGSAAAHDGGPLRAGGARSRRSGSTRSPAATSTPSSTRRPGSAAP